MYDLASVCASDSVKCMYIWFFPPTGKYMSLLLVPLVALSTPLGSICPSNISILTSMTIYVQHQYHAKVVEINPSKSLKINPSLSVQQ